MHIIKRAYNYLTKWQSKIRTEDIVDRVFKPIEEGVRAYEKNLKELSAILNEFGNLAGEIDDILGNRAGLNTTYDIDKYVKLRRLAHRRQI